MTDRLNELYSNISVLTLTGLYEVKIQMFSRQGDEGFFCFLRMWDWLYVKIHKNDTVPSFPCSIVSLYSFPNQEQVRSLVQKVWFFSFPDLKLLCLFVFFFNLNLQKLIHFCSWCQKTTLSRIFLGYSLEHSMAFTESNARTGIPTCALFPGATLDQWLCYLKID